jgi:hypothetical protein
VSKMLARIRQHIAAVDTQGGNRMRESCKYGSVRGARGNSRIYRDRRQVITLIGGGIRTATTTSHGRAESVQIQVESLTVHNGMPMPQRFCLNGRRVDVTETLDQWHGPEYRYVKIKGDNGGLYILRFDEIRAVWELTMFESEWSGGGSDGSRTGSYDC